MTRMHVSSCQRVEKRPRISDGTKRHHKQLTFFHTNTKLI